MTDVVVERQLTAPPELVWQALTSAQSLEQWFWPERLAPTAQADPQPGGHYRIASPVAGMAVSGSYLRVDATELVEFGWQWDGEDVTSTVLIELASAAAGTCLTLRHSGLEPSEFESHAQGWSDCLDRLPGYLAAAGPGE